MSCLPATFSTSRIASGDTRSEATAATTLATRSITPQLCSCTATRPTPRTGTSSPDQFKATAGYTDQELYALSYNGLENGYAGLPTCCSPAPESTHVLAEHPGQRRALLRVLLQWRARGIGRPQRGGPAQLHPGCAGLHGLAGHRHRCPLPGGDDHPQAAVPSPRTATARAGRGDDRRRGPRDNGLPRDRGRYYGCEEISPLEASAPWGRR